MNDSNKLPANGAADGEGNRGPSPMIAYTVQTIGGCGQLVTQALEVLKTSAAPEDDHQVCQAALEATMQAVLATLELLSHYAASKNDPA